MRKTAPLSLVLLGFLFSTPALAADSTRTLKLELSAQESSHFRVENLAGSLKVVPTTGATVQAVASVHAESDKLAGLIRLERVSGENGVPTIRVIYPLDQYDSIRYDARGSHNGGLADLFGSNNTSTKYAGHRVKISSREGVLLYADLEIQVPAAQNLVAQFRNEVGRVNAEGLEGRITFDTSAGDVSLERLKGEIKADTGSGDVKASNLSGTFSCDTGSGDCTLAGFDGEKLSFDVGSGDVSVRSANVRLISADTGSGDILITESDAEILNADTGSGDVDFESRGSRLSKVTADTGSGDVTLRLSPDASFEAWADQGSGDIRMGYRDAEAIVQHKQVIGYRRGDSHIRIDVNTGSGDLRIEPLP